MSRSTQLFGGVIVAVGALFWAGALQAGPTDEMLGKYKEQLDKKIQIQFLDTPLERVAENLQREAGIPFVMDKTKLGQSLTDTVRLEAKQMSIRDALDWACRMTGTDWDLERGVVVVSSADEIARRHAELRVYDIRSMLVTAPDFNFASSLNLNNVLSNTNSGGSGGGGGGGGAGASIFGSTETGVEELSRDEMIQQVNDQIRNSIGDPTEWESNGGTLSSVHERNGILYVRTSPQNHKGIEAFLKGMDQRSSKMVSVECRIFQTTTEQIDNLAADNNGVLILDTKNTDAFLAQLKQGAGAVKPLGAARTTAFNGQRVHVTAFNQESFLSDIQPIPDSPGADPTLSVSDAGSVVDVRPVIGYNGKSIVVTIRTSVVTERTIGTTHVPLLPVITNATITGASDGQDNSSDDDADAADTDADKKEMKKNKAGGDKGRAGHEGAKGASGAAIALLEIGTPKQDLIEYRTTVRVGDGGAVVLTGASNLVKATAAGGEIVVFLRLRAIVPNDNGAE